jgi:hypothetical protein
MDSAGNIYVQQRSRSILRISPRKDQHDDAYRCSLDTDRCYFFNDDLYILEWHDVAADQLEVREAWVPR